MKARFHHHIVRVVCCVIAALVSSATIAVSGSAQEKVPDNALVQTWIEDDAEVADVLYVEPYEDGFLVFFEAEEIDEMTLAPPATSHIGVGYLVVDGDDIQWVHGSVYRDDQKRAIHAHYVHDPYEQAPFPMIFGHVHDEQINEIEVNHPEGATHAGTILDAHENERLWYVANIESSNDVWKIEARHDDEVIDETTLNPRNVYYYFLNYWSVLQGISLVLFIVLGVFCLFFIIRWWRRRKN